MLFYFIALLVTLVDQGTKLAVRMYMEVGDMMRLGDSGMQLQHYENSGMAGSMFQGNARLFGVVAILFIAGILYYRRKGEIRGFWMQAGAGFMVGGALGNAIDRFVFAKVTDFLVFPSGRGILNLADVAINIGVILLVIGMLIRAWKSYRAKRSRNALPKIERW
ncbi:MULTISPECIES: signal peptidase II [Paenibacillus]|jgi:signal peptidase II|uniref:Lipoprotein signal peptidase n=1 Tax=Paenibacillus illinoisensis TaxID=59845 RepID=A0A2W0CES3_9BACL|nr:signal peptidase II [Paenibacillus illinoisensis]MBM6383550.1 signal peptidase II [Paenibacillus sp.]PYY29279.1 Lipoprotein signal peptidase [Paenibacillus illinoisensis]